MNAELWGQVYEHFNAAVGLAPADRPAFLDRTCGDVPSVRDEVAGLLAQHEAASREGFLEPPSPADLDSQPVLDLAKHPRHRIIRKLGEGGMGTVYLAEHRVMGRRVALKVIRHDLMESPGMIERFDREVRAVAQLSHRNIVTAFDAEQVDGSHILVMEYVEGTDLARMVEAQGPLPPILACDAIRQVALGLQHAFDRGMIHRDIKPQNLMRTPEGLVKILDFGVARMAREASTDGGLSRPYVAFRSADYVAPEQIDAPQNADIRADIYSLGCTLYHLLAGHPPFSSRTPMQKLAAHVKDTPGPLTEIRADLPSGLVSVVERMLAKEPTLRYQTPIDVARALAPFADRPAISGPSPVKPADVDARDSTPTMVVLEGVGPPIGEPKPATRHRLLAVIAAAFLLLGVAALGTMIMRLQTAYGTLVIKSDDPDLQVVVTGSGQQVTIGGPLFNAPIQLRVGPHEMKLTGGAGAEIRSLSKDQVTITRGGEQIVTILREEPVPANLEKIAAEIRKLGGWVIIRGEGQNRHAREVGLDNTRASDATLKLLAGQTGLLKLNLGCTSVSDDGLRHLRVHKNLIALNLQETSVTDAGLEHLKDLTSLTLLGLRIPRISDKGLVWLEKMDHLEDLDLFATSITDASLKRLGRFTSLRRLDLQDTRITDAGLEHLKGMTQLRSLVLYKTRVTDAGVSALQRALPDVEIIR